MESVAHGRGAAVKRAKIIWQASQGQQVVQIAEAVGINEKTVCKWFKRFDEQGVEGLEDAPREGAPSRYTPEVKARIIAAAFSHPRDVGRKFGSWTDRAAGRLCARRVGILASRKRAFSRSCTKRDYAGDTRKAGLASGSIPSSPKKGTIERLRKEPPEGSAIVDLDEMGPVSAKSYPGQEGHQHQPSASEAVPSKRSTMGSEPACSVYGALWETTGDRWTQYYPRRCKAYFIDFLCFVDEQIPAEVKRIYVHTLMLIALAARP